MKRHVVEAVIRDWQYDPCWTLSSSIHDATLEQRAALQVYANAENVCDILQGMESAKKQAVADLEAALQTAKNEAHAMHRALSLARQHAHEKHQAALLTFEASDEPTEGDAP